MSGYQVLGHPGTSGSSGRAVNGVGSRRLDLALCQEGKRGVFLVRKRLEGRPWLDGRFVLGLTVDGSPSWEWKEAF